MGLQNTTQALTYARNEYIKQGEHHIFDRVGDMIYKGVLCPNLTITGTDPGRQMYLNYTTTAVGSGKQLQGIQIRVTWAGTSASLNGGITGAEIKARADSETVARGRLGQARAVVGNVDAKKTRFTNGYAFEAAIDVASGGTIDSAIGFRSFLNNSGTVTDGYAFYVDAVSGYPWEYGLYVKSAMATTAIQTGADAADGGDVKFYGATTGEICEWDSSAATLKIQSTHTLSGSTPVNILRINNYPTMAAGGRTRGLLVLSEAATAAGGGGTEGAYLVGIAAIAEQDTTLRVHGVMSAICASLISGTDDPQTMCCVEMTYKNTGASSSSSQSYMLLREYSTGTPCCVFLNMPDHSAGAADHMALFCQRGSTTTNSHVLRILVGGDPYWIMVSSTPPSP